MIKKLSLVSVCFLVSTALLADSAITAQHFSYKAQLIGGSNSLRQVTLPNEILEGMTRYDRGDLRVFSADGQAVPHQFSRAVNEESSQEQGLVFYPFTKAQSADPASVRLYIHQNGAEQKINLRTKAGKSKSSSHEFRYIVENKISQEEGRKPLCSLSFDWTQDKPSMILPFKVEASRDLESWSTLSRKETLSKLNYGESQLIKSRVDLPCTTANYLRLQWLKPEQKIQLNKISGSYQQAGSRKMQWESLAKPSVNEKGEWLFENPSVAPFERLALQAPNNGLLYKGELFARSSESAEWKRLQEIIQYRLKVGDTELSSDATHIYSGQYRYWKIVLEGEAQFSEAQLPEIKVSRQQQQLVYLAQGAEPFVLAFGNSEVGPVNNSGINQLIKTLQDVGTAPENVSLGKVTAITDKVEVSKEMPWKTIGLWVFLLLGTGLMGYMAHSLYRQMNKK